MSISTKIANYPQIDSEELLTKLLSANLFGVETGGALISLDSKTEKLILRIELHHSIPYQEFYGQIESLLNYLDHWKAEVDRLTNETPQGSQDLLF